MSESKVYTKKDFGRFMKTITILKMFNDSVTFNNGLAMFRNSDKTLWIKAQCECPIDIELTKLVNKIPIFAAYVGENVEIWKDDRYYVINNGSELIKFPYAEDFFKISLEEYTNQITNITSGVKMFSWVVDKEKFAALRKYFEGFGTADIRLIKETNGDEIKLRVGDEATTGCAEVASFKIDDPTLISLDIKTKWAFEFISSEGKSFTGVTITGYFIPDKNYLIYVADITTEFCTFQFFRAAPRVMASYC